MKRKFEFEIELPDEMTLCDMRTLQQRMINEVNFEGGVVRKSVNTPLGPQTAHHSDATYHGAS